jgi:CysZ protein
LFGGLGFIVAKPSNWGYAAIPSVIALALTAVLSVGGVAFGAFLSGKILDPEASGAAAIGLWALRIVFALLGIGLALLLALALAQPLSGFALDELSRRQERALGFTAAWPARPGVFWRTLRVTFTGLGFGLITIGPLTIVSLLIPPAAFVTVPLKFIISALVLAWDFLDYPLEQRGFGVRERLQFMTDNFWGVLGLGASAAAVLLIPGVGLLLLPIGVAGAARLAARALPEQAATRAGPGGV